MSKTTPMVTRRRRACGEIALPAVGEHEDEGGAHEGKHGHAGPGFGHEAQAHRLAEPERNAERDEQQGQRLESRDLIGQTQDYQERKADR